MAEISQLEAGTQTEPPKLDASTQAAEEPPSRCPTAAAPICSSKPGTPAAAAVRPLSAARPVSGSWRSATAERVRTPSSARPATAAAAAAVAAVAAETPLESSKLLPCRPKTAGAAVPAQQHRLTAPRPPVGLTDRTPMVLSYNPDPRLRSWQRLEHLRLHKLGLSSKLSRRYNVSRVPDFQPVGRRLAEPTQGASWLPSLLGTAGPPLFYADSARKKNDMGPFKTFQKPTCGVYFTWETDNKKVKHDLEPTDVIKWRYFL